MLYTTFLSLSVFGFLGYGYFKLFVKSKICCEKDIILATIFVVYIIIVDCIEHIKNELMKLEEVKDVHYDAKNSVFYKE